MCLRRYLPIALLFIFSSGCSTDNLYDNGGYSSRSEGIDEVLRSHGAAERLSPTSGAVGMDGRQLSPASNLSLDEILKLQQIINNSMGSGRRAAPIPAAREQMNCTQNGWLLQCNRGRQQISCTRNGNLIQCNDGSSCQINGSSVSCN
jgi:hypothetical protein